MAAALSNVPATLNYLTDAAHLLHSTAPETSAHLMSERHAILLRQDIPLSDVQRQHVCGACGHIMLAGHGDSLRIEMPRRRYRSQKGKPQVLRTVNQGPPYKIINCGNCKKSTRIKLVPPAPITRARNKASKSKSGSSASTPAIETSDTTKKPSANATSKKRAKNRKAGLQALLAGQQTQRANPLSLADFMRK